MVAPLYFREKHVTQPGYVEDSYYYVQRMPRNLPSSATITKTFDRRGGTQGSAYSWEGSPVMAVCDNKARDRFVSQLGDKSSFGATIFAERRDTIDMITSRGVQLLRMARALRRGDAWYAASIAGLAQSRKRPKKTRRRKIKDFGSLWLEYSYGWAPLVSDIYNGCDVIQRPTPLSRLKASAKAQDTKTRIDGVWSQDQYIDKWEQGTTIRSYVQVENPNLWLANQLGLINPASIVWEAVPFSFVIDWFSNVSQFLGSCTDFTGLRLISPCTTRVVKCESLWTQWSGSYLARDTTSQWLIRRPGEIPPVRLVFAYERFQWQRAANAISLLVQFLGDTKR